MDAEYDVNMLSTSLNECILRGLLSIDDLKVLHMDRNEYYGEESTSLNLNKLWTRFRGNDKLLPYLGASRDYSMDMNPRFSLVNGNLVHVLIHTNITHSLNFNVVDGRYVFTEGKIHKRSSLLGTTLDTVKRMKLYAESLVHFQGGSPYTHPFYGLGELPQAFAWLSAVFGETYMLHKLKCNIEFDEEGKIVGVTSE
ncbi:Guanosine nucleotide diphosphate dissociation inhibitor 1 [Glycine soja]|uniref:Guanosine nucleotide diphosphate dissociation inhibitor 1 n=1 Tax=Glycine soja TaxID=3848 RepID=A0A445LPR0_GLYSO|nr:Guanosine nucleotide diphosphate dissociation inhibitor 1 [Glycine soja]